MTLLVEGVSSKPLEIPFGTVKADHDPYFGVSDLKTFVGY